MPNKEFSAYGGDKIIDLENENVVDAFSEAIGGGSGEDFTINFEFNWETQSPSFKACDKTIAEIVANYTETKRIPNISIEGYSCPVLTYSAYYNEPDNYVDLVLGTSITSGSEPYMTVYSLKGYGYADSDADMWEVSVYSISLSLG